MARFGLESIILLLLVLWFVGAFVASPTSDLVHLLLIAVALLIVARLFQARRPFGHRRGRARW